MPTITINQFKGINSTLASLQLKKGEFENSQNLRARPYDNYARRNGVEPVSVQTNPVMGIFEIDLDNVTIPLTQAGDTLTFFDDLSSPSFANPDPYPPGDDLDRGGGRIFLLAIEQAMRAIQDRRVVAGHSLWTWPTISWRNDGTTYSSPQAVSAYPANNVYGPDQAYNDIATSTTIGTKSASLINNLLAACIDTIGQDSGHDWIKTISLQSTVQYYDSTIFPAANSAGTSNYRTVLANIKVGIRKMTTIQQAASQLDTSVESKTGTAQDSAGSCITTDLCISGYSDGFFSGGSAAGCDGCPGGDIWDGRMIFNGAIGPTTCQYGLDPLSENCTIMNNKDINRVTLRYDPTGVGLSGFSIEPSGGFLCTCNYLWAGEKTTGLNSPYGVYTRSEGCYTSPATLTIVAC